VSTGGIVSRVKLVSDGTSAGTTLFVDNIPVYGWELISLTFDCYGQPELTVLFPGVHTELTDNMEILGEDNDEVGAG
jgi:hypothetical protein